MNETRKHTHHALPCTVRQYLSGEWSSISRYSVLPWVITYCAATYYCSMLDTLVGDILKHTIYVGPWPGIDCIHNTHIHHLHVVVGGVSQIYSPIVDVSNAQYTLETFSCACMLYWSRDASRKRCTSYAICRRKKKKKMRTREATSIITLVYNNSGQRSRSFGVTASLLPGMVGKRSEWCVLLLPAVLKIYTTYSSRL